MGATRKPVTRPSPMEDFKKLGVDALRKLARERLGKASGRLRTRAELLEALGKAPRPDVERASPVRAQAPARVKPPSPAKRAAAGEPAPAARSGRLAAGGRDRSSAASCAPSVTEETSGRESAGPAEGTPEPVGPSGG